MTALTTLFNYLVAYITFYSAWIFGFEFFYNNLNPDVASIVRDIQVEAFQMYPELAEKFATDGFVINPIVLLPICIFALGALIGLVRRLIRG